MAIAFVREGGAGAIGGGEGGLTLVLNVVAAGHALGNTLVVCVSRGGGLGALSVSDSKGNTYTLRQSAGGSGSVQVWTAYLTAALVSGDTISISGTETPTLLGQVQEFLGVSQSDPVDVTAVANGAFGGGAGNAFAVLPTTGGAGRYLVGCLSYWFIEPSDTPVLGAGWTAGQNTAWDYGTTQDMLRVARRGPMAAGTYTVGWTVATYTASPVWAIVAIALQDDTAGVPTAPSGLSATAVSASQINLAWTDNSSDETGFHIERSTDNTVFTQIATVASNATSYSSTGLAAATLYYYRVRATNANGNSAYSNTASATTLAGSGETSPPTAPASLTALGIGSSRIQLEWQDLSSNETGFKIERSLNGTTGWVQVGTAGEDVTTWVNSGLASSTRYYYRVRAFNSAGNSGYTNVATAATLASDTSGAGDCPVERYASVADVQALIWSSLLAISDNSEPSRATVEDWLCEWSLWLDSTLRWKYVVPVTHAQDRERLRPICARLAAADCWDVLKPRNPGMEKRAEEMRAVGLNQLVWHPGGTGSWLPGSSSVMGLRPYDMGRAMLVLPNTTLSDSGEAELGQVLSSFTDPENEGPERILGAGRVW